MAANRMIHLSDLHVGQHDYEELRARRIFETVAKQYPGVPVLITGDLTDSGNLHQMQTVRAMLDLLARTNPILSVPGNHDYAWKGNVFYSRCVTDWNETLGYTLGWPEKPSPWMLKGQGAPMDGLGYLESGDVLFVGVDSGDPKNHEQTARGYISEDLAAELSRLLDQHASKTRVVLLHHHPFDHNLFMALEGSERFLAAVKNRCEVLLFGHDHHVGLWREWGQAIPFVYASHKSTENLFGDHLVISVLQIDRGSSGPAVWHRLEVV